jgi:hypothetical protein
MTALLECNSNKPASLYALEMRVGEKDERDGE